ncbi:MAG: phenylalanine--tRNA ligase subunit beta [Verrucomicrobiae bacterium]|nr:phenylalanine--tRNA ligase subunit beta [Verrucomicrobiae bacterium]
MKYSLNWLKELVQIPWTVDELAAKLTMAGIEVEGIQAQGQGLDRVVVAQILKSDRHPNADRLSVCEVDTGNGKAQIVCGAKNYQVGDKVPLAMIGAKLPCGIEIKPAKLRGVESRGMMCSPKELGMAEDAQGLLILPPDLKVGTPFAEAMGLNDVIFDLEITPNRPDLLSHWGLARDLAALSGLDAPDPLKLLPAEMDGKLSETSSGEPVFFVQVVDGVRCPRYTARVIRGVKVGPSPDWLKRRMESLGQRSISNVVDVTNYILQEIGQPLHAFDLALLKGGKIIVRTAQAGGKIALLDGSTHELKPDMLVIADAERAVAVAGVMGGSETAVSEKTVDLLLESATFQPSSIRKTSKVLGVASDSSYRYERGVDVELAAWASRRATALFLQICGGRVEGPLVDCRAQTPVRKTIVCRPDRVSKLLGKELAEAEMTSILQRLGCRAGKKEGGIEVNPPTFRPDLEREIDLIEEIGRVHGVENIPAAMAPVALSTTHDNELYLLARRVRGVMSAQGVDEALTYTVTASEILEKTTPADAVAPLILANPLSGKMNALRDTLLHGLLEAAGRHVEIGGGAALYELGRVFSKTGDGVGEKMVLGLILSGNCRTGASWERESREKNWDWHDLQGVVENLLERLGIGEARMEAVTTEKVNGLEKGMTFRLMIGEKEAGILGRVEKTLRQAQKIQDETFYAELDLAELAGAQRQRTRYKAWPAYPSVRRDIAMVVAAGEKHLAIERILRNLAKEIAESRKIFLKNVEMFDIFLSSDKIGAGKKSLAYALTYQSGDRTLTDQEVNDIHEMIKRKFREKVACEIRES